MPARTPSRRVARRPSPPVAAEGTPGDDDAPCQALAPERSAPGGGSELGPKAELPDVLAMGCSLPRRVALAGSRGGGWWELAARLCAGPARRASAARALELRGRSHAALEQVGRTALAPRKMRRPSGEVALWRRRRSQVAAPDGGVALRRAALRCARAAARARSYISQAAAHAAAVRRPVRGGAPSLHFPRLEAAFADAALLALRRCLSPARAGV